MNRTIYTLFAAVVFLLFTGVIPQRASAVHECCQTTDAETTVHTHDAPSVQPIAESAVSTTEAACCIALPLYGSLCSNPFLCNCDCSAGTGLLFVTPLGLELPRQKKIAPDVFHESFLQNLAFNQSAKLQRSEPLLRVLSTNIYHLNCVYRI